MIETYLSGQAGLDWIAAALFAVGLTLLISDALLPGLGPGGVIGLICQIACFAPDLVGGSSAWSVLVLAAVGSALLLVDGRLAGIGPIGILGAVLLLAALWQTAQDAYIFLLTLCASAVMTGIAIPLQLARLPDSKSMKKIQLYTRSEIPEQSPDEMPQIGMLGETFFMSSYWAGFEPLLVNSVFSCAESSLAA